MADFEQALGAAYERWYQPRYYSRPITHGSGLRDRLHALEKAYGSKAAAARAAGVGASSWRAWTAPKGSSSRRAPSPAALGKVEQAYRAVARQQRAPHAGAGGRMQGKRPPREFAVHATVVGDPRGARYTNTTPQRWFRATEAQDAAARGAEAWLRGDPPSSVAATVLGRIEAAYAIPFGFEGEAKVNLS